MKHKIYCISFVLVLFLMMPVTVFGAYYATEDDVLSSLFNAQPKTVICQNVKETGCGTYTSITRSHVQMGCTQDAKKASTTVHFNFGAGKSCYARTAVFNMAGVNAITVHKDGSSFLTTATASANVTNINVKSVLHTGMQPQFCSKGEHNYLLMKY